MSEVILIGDRAVGKTQSVRKLLEPPTGKITISNVDPQLIASSATKDFFEKTLEIQAALRAPKRLSVDWVDTPGGWNEIGWQSDPERLPDLNRYQTKLSNAKALVLLLRPYRTAGKTKISDKQIIQEHGVSTETQWCRRFQRWVSFINDNCIALNSLNLCLSKADLFCDVHLQADTIQNKGWLDQSLYIYKEFFPANNPLFQQSLKALRNGTVRFFVVSIYNRHLLELPWLSLATNL
jgi:hypothetical protein